ncbi:MAG: methionine gamma-lyase family protein [Clostridia bacterium]|nr:methionine gamma-lyase family protein [Clostridia bacterium]
MTRQELSALFERAETDLTGIYAGIDRTAERNTARVLEAFCRHRVSASHFASTDGYGYDDAGREAVEAVWADVFGCEAALVRPAILCGSHALTVGLFGLLRPGDILLSATGSPYDTLRQVVGLEGEEGRGSLRDFGVGYREVPLSDGRPDLPAVIEALKEEAGRVKVVFVQRSKGYLDRASLSSEELGELIAAIRPYCGGAYVMVDNCYGEFVSDDEPSARGADLTVGSLIKNPGGGMAEIGGYLCGTKAAVQLCAYRYSAPGMGAEVGASLGQNKSILKGLFFAPHTVAQALKVAHLAAYVFSALGYPASPAWDEPRADIIQSIRCGSAEGLVAFVRGIQHGSPVDAYLTCDPWDMPGYADPVIMAAGTFTQGSSIELSADGPLRPPYLAYLQGGLTYESGKYALMKAAAELTRCDE